MTKILRKTCSSLVKLFLTERIILHKIRIIELQKISGFLHKISAKLEIWDHLSSIAPLHHDRHHHAAGQCTITRRQCTIMRQVSAPLHHDSALSCCRSVHHYTMTRLSYAPSCDSAVVQVDRMLKCILVLLNIGVCFLFM